ncbi:hypothetical protein HJFPF1_03503 [Paramyrothecium foliicola]|nr:hypothetical protein HJFPF1_03503 [Paramyrothecium foliicola]
MLMAGGCVKYESMREASLSGGGRGERVPGACDCSRTFHSFGRLPTELRLRIWKLSLPASRFVPIRCGLDADEDDESSCSRALTTGCVSTIPIPAALHTCVESREVALESYSLLFGFARGPGQVFFRPDTDILFFGARKGYMAADAQLRTCMSLCAPADLGAVRRVAVSDALFWIGPEYRSMTAGALSVELIHLICSRMPALEEIIFVPREEDLVLPPKKVMQRMGQQIQASMETISRQVPHWRSPAWRIQPLEPLDALNV